MAFKISVVALPEHPLEEMLALMKKIDELGLHGFWFVDETYHKDCWIIMAAAARETKRIVMGPAVTHIYLRDPTHIAQMLATLSELSHGRAAAIVSIGNLIMLQQYHVKWEGTRPLERLREAFKVMRALLEEGKVTFEGKHFKYTGLFTAARPHGKVPLYMGAMGGPRSFQLAGEIADGLCPALGYSEEFWKDVQENFKKGAERAGRKVEELELACWPVVTVARNADAAREAAKTIVGFYIPSMPPRQLKLHGIDPASVQEINNAFFRGDVETVIKLTTMDIVEKLSLSGSPEDVIQKLKKNFVPYGVSHMIACIIDPFIVKFFTGREIPGLPDFVEQARLLKEEVAPALS
jgi:5,10-methylenetetrahydromethanopterin reductase